MERKGLGAMLGNIVAGYRDKDRQRCAEGMVDVIDEVKRLRGTLKYIAVQAKANHPGALKVIQMNAEAALEGTRPPHTG